jgi:toxin ParE1/3/4
MEVGYHPLARRDLLRILRHYHKISERLELEFEQDLENVIELARLNPSRFSTQGEFRRAGLKRFPYHFLYEVHSDHIRIFIVRHDRRHPNYGLARK